MTDFKDENNPGYTWNQYAVWIIKLLERLEKLVEDLLRRVIELELFRAHSSEERVCRKIDDIEAKIKDLEIINARYTGERLGKKATWALIGALIMAFASLIFGILGFLTK